MDGVLVYPAPEDVQTHAMEMHYIDGTAKNILLESGSETKTRHKEHGQIITRDQLFKLYQEDLMSLTWSLQYLETPP